MSIYVYLMSEHSLKINIKHCYFYTSFNGTLVTSYNADYKNKQFNYKVYFY